MTRSTLGPVAELLILREDMPRSLHHCYSIVLATLDELRKRSRLSAEGLRATRMHNFAMSNSSGLSRGAA